MALYISRLREGEAELIFDILTWSQLRGAPRHTKTATCEVTRPRCDCCYSYFHLHNSHYDLVAVVAVVDRHHYHCAVLRLIAAVVFGSFLHETADPCYPPRLLSGPVGMAVMVPLEANYWL